MIENFQKIFAPVLTGKENLNSKEIQVLCPFHQDKNASMSINTEKGLYNCFACNAKGSAIGFFMKYNNLTYPEALKALDMDQPLQQKPIKQPMVKVEPPRIDTDYSDYCLKVAENVFDNYEFFCQKLFNMRGITMPTAICCFIGYDHTKGWIFPCIRYSDKKIVGYEVREKYFQMFKFKDDKETKCYKAKNTPSCLCEVFGAWTKKTAIVCEGFIDAYKMYQFQHEKVQLLQKNEHAQVDVSVLTSSCGVKHLPELVEKAELWNDFEEVIFVLDNDEAGNLAKEKLASMDHQDKFKFFNQLQEGEDFENWYDRKRKHTIVN